MKINPSRLLSRLKKLNKIGALPNGGNCRLALTNEDKKGRDLLVTWMRQEGLEVRIDQVGNIYGIRKGIRNGPALGIGSHLDTVTTGGRYDGAYGVLAGLEVISVLNEKKIKTKRPLILINFTNEEGNRFAPDMMGSFAVSKPKQVGEIWKSQALDGCGVTVKSELERIGYLGKVKCGSIPIEYFLELHIEQGPILEQEMIDIGIVEKVSGIYWTEYILQGQAAHAGTTPLENRKDAGLVAARINLGLREIAEEIPNQRATIGLMEFYPNVANVVPDRVRLITDIRNADKTLLSKAQEMFDQYVQFQCKNEGVQVTRKEKVRLQPIDFSPKEVERIAKVCAKLGYSSKHMVSGAGHDAQLMSAVCKAAMIFVPSVGGVSHHPKEFTKPKDLERGAEVLLQTALEILGGG